MILLLSNFFLFRLYNSHKAFGQKLLGDPILMFLFWVKSDMLLGLVLMAGYDIQVFCNQTHAKQPNSHVKFLQEAY